MVSNHTDVHQFAGFAFGVTIWFDIIDVFSLALCLFLACVAVSLACVAIYPACVAVSLACVVVSLACVAILTWRCLLHVFRCACVAVSLACVANLTFLWRSYDICRRYLLYLLTLL